ncbi:DUF6623 family protein [Nonomuraea sp. NPDC049714]|uniref:DUF6623 family protein n=1 Tax=Nonomuraea sp. NPDC049714 TaxID=3364357 RepID=UPI003795CB92
MSKLYASWQHGFTAVAEKPSTSALRQGFGVTFTLPANGGDWIHLAIPTPVIVEDRRAGLDRVLIFFNARETSALLHVHVWDGPNQILVRDNLEIKGDHSHGIDGNNVFPVGRDGIGWGCGISLFFTAGASNSHVFIAGFGGDFRHDI